MPKLRYDTQDLAVQVDVIRAHLRALYSRDGPPPADLAPDHDMLWPERESERLEHLALADAAAAEAARKTEQRLKELEGEKSARYRNALNAANAADANAKQARINADEAKRGLDEGYSRAAVPSETEKATIAQAEKKRQAEASAEFAAAQQPISPKIPSKE